MPSCQRFGLVRSLSNLPIPQLRSEISVSLDPSTRSRAHNPEWTQMIIILMQGPLSSGQMKAIPALSVGCWKLVLVRHLLDGRRRSELPQHLRRSLRRTPATVPTGLTCSIGLLRIRLASHTAASKRPCVCRRLHAPATIVGSTRPSSGSVGVFLLAARVRIPARSPSRQRSPARSVPGSTKIPPTRGRASSAASRRV